MSVENHGLGRRTVLKTIGAGVAVTAVGAGAAQGRACPDCPGGTALLAKYEWEDGSWEADGGACPEAITNIQNVETDSDGDPHEVDYSSKIYVQSVFVKAGPDCELDEDGGTDDEKDGNFEGTVPSPNRHAISHINFCAPVCYQVDFVEGDPIVDFDEEGPYGRDRIITFKWGGTSDEHDVESGNFTDDGSYTTDDGCELTLESDGISFENGEASVEFMLNSVDGDGCELSLVSYIATCPPGFDTDTAGLQVLFDADPDYADSYLDSVTENNTFTSDEEGKNITLTTQLPGVEHLNLLCENI